MVTFNNVLEITYESILHWDRKECLNSVTIIRDVFGRISLLLDNTVKPDTDMKETLASILTRNLNTFFSNKIYWKKPSDRWETGRIQPIIDMIESERKEWKEYENIRFYLSERPVAKKAWIQQNSASDSVWPYEEAIQENGSKVVTFYSFKGGMGRTTALAGVALSLVKQGFHVMMLDTDIEAPGLSTLFFDDEVIQRGLLDYLLEHPLTPERDIREYILDITDPVLLEETDGNLYLMPAGKVDANYLQKLARIDYQDNRKGFLEDSLKTLLVSIRESYSVDYILIDARAGFHDMGGIVVSQIPHGAVLFGNSSRQSWDGITQVFRSIAENHTDDFPVVLVDSMCEKPTSPTYTQSKDTFIQKAYTVCMENYYDNNMPVPGIEAEGEAHSPEFISFDAALLNGIELFSSGNPEQDTRVKAYLELLTGSSYQKIAERIKHWFGED